jgi:predicted exporter
MAHNRLAMLIAAVLLLLRGAPVLDHGSGALRPRDSAAYAALEQIKERMDRPGEPLWLLIQGPDDATVARRLAQVAQQLDTATKTGGLRVTRFPIPSGHIRSINSPIVPASKPCWIGSPSSFKP